jgi:parvulin-like peptidyl-prolyl isomerase
MKILQVITLLLLTTSAFGQSSVGKDLQTVVSIEEAEKFVQSHPKLQPALQVHNSRSDTSDLDRQLYQLKKGDVLQLGNYSYKIIADTLKYAFKASYIYLDGSRLSQVAIDSLRKLILQRYSTGTTFEQLADGFTMDGNRNHGDLGVFLPGMMVKEFEEAVHTHANGEVFTVDVPDHQWYYVVKKTAPTQVTQEMSVLQVKVR